MIPSVLLSVRDLSLAFGGVQVLDGVTFDIQRGAIFGLIGPNGAGKTSLFNCVSGLYPVNRGEILLDGRSLRGLRPESLAGLGIARSFQHPALFAGLTVIEQVLVALEARIPRATGWADVLLLPASDRRAKNRHSEARSLLDRLGLGPLAGRSVAMLSLAERRRVEIARALALQPKLLLLDEPAAGLDSASQQALADLLREACERSGLTVLLIDHRMGWVRALCDRLVALHAGRVIAQGDTESVCNDPAVVQAYLGPVTEFAPVR